MQHKQCEHEHFALRFHRDLCKRPYTFMRPSFRYQLFLILFSSSIFCLPLSRSLSLPLRSFALFRCDGVRFFYGMICFCGGSFQSFRSVQLTACLFAFVWFVCIFFRLIQCTKSMVFALNACHLHTYVGHQPVIVLDYYPSTYGWDLMCGRILLFFMTLYSDASERMLWLLRS